VGSVKHQFSQSILTAGYNTASKVSLGPFQVLENYEKLGDCCSRIFYGSHVHNASLVPNQSKALKIMMSTNTRQLISRQT